MTIVLRGTTTCLAICTGFKPKILHSEYLMGGEDEKQIFCSVLHVSLIVATIFFRRYEFISRYSEKK